jgi:uncharacterized membrane protein
MNLKRIFGGVLTTLGIIALIYGAYSFMTTKTGSDWKSLLVCIILGIVFFSAGIGLVKGTKDEA